VQATVGYLTGRLGASQRDVAEVLHPIFHLDLGLGQGCSVLPHSDVIQDVVQVHAIAE
jgi:hypothetical protein